MKRSKQLLEKVECVNAKNAKSTTNGISFTSNNDEATIKLSNNASQSGILLSRNVTSTTDKIPSISTLEKVHGDQCSKSESNSNNNILRLGELPPKIAKHIEVIKKMREKADAPVDTMGCHMLADPNAEPKVYRFQTLIALMLSSQTKDQVVAAAMERLKAHGCTIDSLLNTPQAELEEIICPVGFYKRKAVYIQRTANILKERYDYDIPNTIEDITSLPGVGFKMGYLTLQIAFNINDGIGVDTHVHRIANRLHWVNTKTPNKTEVQLKQILPRDQWSTINKLLVGFGQQICLPVKPKCKECLNKELCPFVNK